MHQLPYKRIALGISSSIAAYKSAELVRLLKKQGAAVRVVMTEGAQSFITPLTLQALSGNPIHSDIFDAASEAAMGHIELAKWADLVLIAPASANILAKLAHGLADDLLSTLCLATTAPIVLAPAMNQAMWRNAQTQHNAKRCAYLKMRVLGPSTGDQACGDNGPGRMLEPSEILSALSANETQLTNNKLAGKHVLITAGPTREAIDPVRFLSNPSTGKMGFALAQAAVAYGAQVTLIAGPVQLSTPDGVTRIDVNSALEMHAQACAISSDIFIACAAVADYRPAEVHAHKVKKTAAELDIRLVRNPDILADISQRQPRPFCVGFAAETQMLTDNAQLKLQKKSLDMIVANDISERDVGFESNSNQVQVLWQQHQQIHQKDFALMSKTRLAAELIELIAHVYHST